VIVPEQKNFSEVDFHLGRVAHVLKQIVPLSLDDVAIFSRTAVADARLGSTDLHQTKHDQDSQHLQTTCVHTCTAAR